MYNKLFLLAYQSLSTIAGLLGWPWFYWHLKSRGRGESFRPRLGLQLPDPPPPGHPRIWIHGVSVGEILAALPLVEEIKALLPQAAFIISTGTETGQALARRHFAPSGALVCYFPLDLPWAVNRYLRHVRPHLFVALESEIWPSFLTQAHHKGVPLALVNARISDKTFRRLLKYKKYLIDIIKLYKVVGAGSPLDFHRFLALGLPPQRLHFTGNLKVDALFRAQTANGQSQQVREFAAYLAVAGRPVFLAASTHPGEEELVLEAVARLHPPYPALLFLLAPRHPERAGEVGRLLAGRGISYHLWSRLKAGEERRRHGAVIIDTIGDLFDLFGVADVAFVGGSLIPHGGQNILEPAVWGLSPLYGPHIANFRWAQEILTKAGAGTLVTDAASLAAAARRLLDSPELRRDLGARAHDALIPHQGAACRQAALIAGLLDGSGRAV